MFLFFFFFFKQKTAYEMRISDWSSDVCSSDLFVEDMEGQLREIGINDVVVGKRMGGLMSALGGRLGAIRAALATNDLVEFSSEIGRASCRERVCQYV